MIRYTNDLSPIHFIEIRTIHSRRVNKKYNLSSQKNGTNQNTDGNFRRQIELVCTLLRDIVGAVEVVERTLTESKALNAGANARDVAICNKELSGFRKTESSAMIIFMTSMTEETVKKI
ncbi:hypothetical protein JTB14_003540 [Gonioctena quinquepunctata]|nr:hypothetical protein JTB14_003540 [Gonioctena quinquepunctata]